MEKQKERLIELIRKSGCVDTWNYNADDFKEPNPIEKLADILLANGVIVPPCKVGDVLWTFSYGKVVSGEVIEIKWQCEAENHGVFIREKISTSGVYTATIDFCDVGKTVFLTKEEAEQALRKDEGK